MAHERDEKYEGQDDSEYHFSDDQVSYESADVKPASASKSRAEIMAKIIYYKRPLIGVGVFLVLIFLVYKIITPSTSTAPTAEFTQGAQASTSPAAEPTKAIASEPPAAPVKMVAPAEPQPTAVSSQPNLAPTPQTTVTMPQAPEQPVQPQQQQLQQQQQAAIPPAPFQQPAAQQPVQSAPTMPAQAMSQPEVMTPPPPSPTTMNQPPQAIPQPQPVMPTASMSVPERLTVLETQGAKTQSDLMQKISEQEAQNVALQGKLQDLNMRMTSLEATLIRLGRIMHEMKGGKAIDETMSGEPVRMMARPAPLPKVTYSVQAIIPGRAWLKSESGETVTVAEGDVVKDLGRVVKIDPYDGVVQVDSNGRMVSLSYGAPGGAGE